jgi:sugar lactone lactonase YvrE
VADSGNGRVRRIDLATGTIETVLGAVDLSSVEGSSALTLPLSVAAGVDLDSTGRLFVSDSGNHRVFRIESDGSVATVAGSGDLGIRERTFDGDGGPASAALLDSPHGIDVTAAGEVYVADTGNHRIRRVDATGTITTVAGSGSSTAGGYSGDGGPAVTARLRGPRDVLATDSGGFLIADSENCVVRQVTGTTIDAFAGTGVCATGDVAGPPLSRDLGIVVSLGRDAGGTVWVADRGTDEVDPSDDVIWRVPTSGDMQPMAMPGAVVGMLYVDSAGDVLFTTGDSDAVTDDERVWRYAPPADPVLIGGGGTAGRGDGLAATSASFVTPAGVVADASGNLAVADAERVRCIDSTSSIVSTVAGRLHADGPLAHAGLTSPAALVTGAAGVWWVADGGRVRQIDLSSSRVDTVVGYPQGLEQSDNSAADASLARLLGGAGGIVYDSVREVIFVTEPERQIISIVDVSSTPVWTIQTYAGTEGVHGYESDGSKWEAPTGLALDSDVLYAADAGNHVVMKIDLTDDTTTLMAGEPRVGGDAPDGALAMGGRLSAPSALAVGADGSLYVADTGNHKVRRIDASGSMTTVIGTGEPGSTDSSLPAREQLVDTPAGLALDGFGNLFVSSAGSVRVVAAGDDGIATGEDRVHTVYGAPPPGEFPATATLCLSGLALESGDDSVLVLDRCQGMLVRITRTGIL